MSTPAATKLARAYTTLICRHPFFATILLRLKRVQDDTPDVTMWTDGVQLGYGPAFVESLSDDELLGVLCHEVLHVTGLHPWRQAHRDNKRWNLCCDAVVNHHTTAAGFSLPKGGVPAVADTTPEALYALTKFEPAGKGYGEVRPATGSEAEQQQSMHEAKILTRQAITAAKAAGQLPKGMELYCDEALEPKVPWREVLANFLDAWAKVDYSWSRPNVRYMHTGFVLPTLWAETYGTICVGADMSGSVDRTERREIMSEILGGLACYSERGQPPTATVAWFDHAVYPQDVSDVDDMRDLKPKGGGGTSFRVVMEWLAAQEAPYRCCIMITDGECSDYGIEPSIPVLWILTRPNTYFKPPYGTVLCTL